MIKAGMNVARFNFSHGTHEMHKKRFDELVALRDKLDLPIATMLDTKGPEIRIGYFKDHKAVTLKEGDDYILTSRDIECDEKQASVSFKELPQDVKMGTIIRINDGLVSLRVEKVEGPDIYCKVVDGGVISDQKGINVPDTNLSMPYLSEHDMSDLAFGAKLGFDFIAASFIRSAADVDYLRNFTNSVGFHKVKIIAKIENMSGVNNIDEIIAAADGIMIARGDMGVEIPFELIPSIQKKLIKKAYTAGKQVITATQMLESMITNARPTRAEITDVANAIYDGTSAIMLSGETAAGKHPVEAVETMALIAETTEADIDYLTKFKNDSSDYDNSITNAISHAIIIVGKSNKVGCVFRRLLSILHSYTDTGFAYHCNIVVSVSACHNLLAPYTETVGKPHKCGTFIYHKRRYLKEKRFGAKYRNSAKLVFKQLFCLGYIIGLTRYKIFRHGISNLFPQTLNSLQSQVI